MKYRKLRRYRDKIRAGDLYRPYSRKQWRRCGSSVFGKTPDRACADAKHLVQCQYRRPLSKRNVECVTNQVKIVQVLHSRLDVAMNTLRQIAVFPRQAKARRLANGALDLLVETESSPTPDKGNKPGE